jgi:hypothetical protein
VNRPGRPTAREVFLSLAALRLQDVGFYEDQAHELAAAGYDVIGWVPVVEPLAVAA